MADNGWLRTYYGKDFDAFNPTVLIEGKKFAVVRLLGNNAPAIAYVLIKKNGRHNASSQQSLYEGAIDADVMEKLKSALTRAEQN
jgi:hypothetical protein